ncbi:MULTISPECIES: TetR/AcrR family transcriptional regulator [unclassified Streptomyces]|uniref:TetR/AcrR family transcriptional regulator n=1 Tax=unclassified Streptomyces TaxID=2593676 RepID=UPI001E54EB7F|nr:TetR/AcrR family transcriptional regulator [Streptomyces sp. CB02980]MCB8902351.1 TetR/AcrR family transcriptional regulator [Streptomyces sp. CB02980]
MSQDATPASPKKPMRADARRNYERILAAAGEAIAQHGADASLEEIARHAGVGSATLHRHFPSRQALLESVFRDRVESLCATARDLAATTGPEAALVTWLHAVGTHAVTNKGLGAALMPGTGSTDPTLGDDCHTMIVNAGGGLLARAHQAGAVRPEVTITRLLKLVGAIALATEHDADGAAETDRLLTLVIDGVRPRG